MSLADHRRRAGESEAEFMERSRREWEALQAAADARAATYLAKHGAFKPASAALGYAPGDARAVRQG